MIKAFILFLIGSLPAHAQGMRCQKFNECRGVCVEYESEGTPECDAACFIPKRDCEIEKLTSNQVNSTPKPANLVNGESARTDPPFQGSVKSSNSTSTTIDASHPACVIVQIAKLDHMMEYCPTRRALAGQTSSSAYAYSPPTPPAAARFVSDNFFTNARRYLGHEWTLIKVTPFPAECDNDNVCGGLGPRT